MADVVVQFTRNMSPKIGQASSIWLGFVRNLYRYGEGDVVIAQELLDNVKSLLSDQVYHQFVKVSGLERTHKLYLLLYYLTGHVPHAAEGKIESPYASDALVDLDCAIRKRDMANKCKLPSRWNGQDSWKRKLFTKQAPPTGRIAFPDFEDNFKKLCNGEIISISRIHSHCPDSSSSSSSSIESTSSSIACTSSGMKSTASSSTSMQSTGWDMDQDTFNKICSGGMMSISRIPCSSTKNIVDFSDPVMELFL